MKRFLGIGILLTVIMGASMGQELRQERFLMTFIPNVQFSPLYVALEQGYFAEAGFALEVEYLNEPDVVDLVATGQATFGLVSGEQVILSVAQSRPIISVYNWFQEYPIGIVVSAESDIQTVADLRGVTVGIPGRFGASYSGLTALLTANGMTESDISLEEIGFNAPEVFCLGVVQASVVYSNNEPLQIRNRAQAGDCGAVQDVRVIRVSDSLDLVSNGLITSLATRENNPELVQAGVTAWHRGLFDVITNPASAYLMSAVYVENLPLSEALEARLQALSAEQMVFLETDPDNEAIRASRTALLETLRAEFTPDELIQFEVLMATIALWDSETLGEYHPESWDTMQDILLEMGILDTPMETNMLYTNEFVPNEAE